MQSNNKRPVSGIHDSKSITLVSSSAAAGVAAVRFSWKTLADLKVGGREGEGTTIEAAAAQSSALPEEQSCIGKGVLQLCVY